MSQHKLTRAVTCLRISEVAYLLVAPAVSPWFLHQTNDPWTALPYILVIFVFCLALVVGIECVVRGLQRRRPWAWAVADGLFELYVPSLFLPLGIIGQRALREEGTRAEFGMVSGDLKTGSPPASGPDSSDGPSCSGDSERRTSRRR